MSLISARILALPVFFCLSTPLLASGEVTRTNTVHGPSDPSPAAGESAAAPAATERPSSHEGFYMAFNAGGGPRSVRLNGVSDMNIDGDGAALGVLIGGAASPNLLFHGSIYGAMLEKPEISVDDTTVVTDRASLFLFSAGPGITYYFMPANVYVGGSILLAQNKLEIDGTEFESEWGVGAEVRIGKHFWTTNHMLLGFSAQGIAAKMNDQNTTDTIEFQAANIYLDCAFDFSATKPSVR